MLEEQEEKAEGDYARMAELKSKELQLNTELNSLLEKGDPQLSMENLAHVIELWTKIPAAKIREQEFQRLSQLESRLKSHIIGQDEAVQPCPPPSAGAGWASAPSTSRSVSSLWVPPAWARQSWSSSWPGPVQHAGCPDPAGYVGVHGEALRLPRHRGFPSGLCGL